MASEIIPVLSKEGHYTSVSIDADLFNILRFDFKDAAECRAWIRIQAKLHNKSEGMTREVRYRCLSRIARPPLIRSLLAEAEDRYKADSI